jgi:uncharacterized protein DUF2809
MLPSNAPVRLRRARDRRVYALLVLVTIVLGLSSRRYGGALPQFVAAYAGDTLWAAMVFLLLGLAFRRQPTRLLAIVALTASFLVEFSQLYRDGWLHAVRATRLGALVLGSGFLWSDLLCYAAGVALAAVVDMVLTRERAG